MLNSFKKINNMVAVRTDKQKSKKPVVPDYLIYEELEGVPVYYRGYQNVLQGKQTPDEIMGYGYLQALLLTYLKDYLQPIIGKEMLIIQGETGLHVGHKSNPSLDLCIYPKADISIQKATKTYLDIAPTVVVEVDTKADVTAFEQIKGTNYFLTKTQKLLDFGTKEMIWIFTKDQKVMVARPNQPWLTVGWKDEIEILGHRFSINQIIKESESEQE